MNSTRSGKYGLVDFKTIVVISIFFESVAWRLPKWHETNSSYVKNFLWNKYEKNVGNNKRTFIQHSRAVIKGPWQLNWKIEDTFSFLLFLSSSSITMCLVFRFKPVSLRNFSKKHFCNADPVRTFWRCQKCFYITSTWIK